MPNETNIIITEHNLVVMPVRKAGCSSITEACKTRIGRQHFHLRNNSFVPEWKARGALVATFARHPFDRFVSFYEHLVIRSPYKALIPFGITGGMAFEDVAELVAGVSDEDADIHFRGQVFSLSLDGEFLPNWIGTFETLYSSWADFCEHTTAPLPKDLPHRNKSDRRPWHTYYNDRTMALIRERYAADFEVFGY